MATEPTDNLIFQDPPPKHSGGTAPGQSPLGLWLAALRLHPGRWAMFPEPMHASLSHNIRSGTGYGVKAGEFEVRTVKAEGRKHHFYARYVGEAGA